MKRAIATALVAAVGLCLMGQAARADDAADAKAAIKKLADAPNYSWTSTTDNAGFGGRGGGGGGGARGGGGGGEGQSPLAQGGGGGGGFGGGGGGGGGRGGRGGRGGGFGGGGPTAGKADNGGYVTFTLAIMQQNYDVVMKGDKAVVKMTDGWKTKDELQTAAQAGGGGRGGGGGGGEGQSPLAQGGGGGGGFGGGGGGGGGGRGFGGFGPEFQILNAINNFKTPVQQANEIADKMANVKKTADGYSADMAADQAKTMATPNFGRGGRGGAGGGGGGGGGGAAFEVSGAKGTMALTVNSGTPSKIVIHLEGSMSFNGNDIPINRTTTIEIKDVGSTKLDIPADAKAKLDAMK